MNIVGIARVIFTKTNEFSIHYTRNFDALLDQIEEHANNPLKPNKSRLYDLMAEFGKEYFNAELLVSMSGGATAEDLSEAKRKAVIKYKPTLNNRQDMADRGITPLESLIERITIQHLQLTASLEKALTELGRLSDKIDQLVRKN